MEILESRSSGRDGWVVLSVALFAQVGVSVCEMGLPLMTGFIKEDLGLTPSLAGLLVSVFFVGKLVGSYAAGMIADLVGEVRVLAIGGLLTGGLVVAAMWSPAIALLILLAAAGASSAGGTPAGGRLVRGAFPPNRQGLALGIRQTGVPVGGIIAAALLPWIAHEHGWRVAMTIAGLVTVVAVLPLLKIRESRPDRHRERPEGFRATVTLEVRLLTLWACFAVTGQFAVLIFIPLQLHEQAGVSLAAAASIAVAAQVTGILGRIVWAALSDRSIEKGRSGTLVAVTIGGLLSAILLALLPAGTPLTVWVVGVAFAGFTLIGYQGLWITMVTDAAPASSVGAATGFAVMLTIASIAITPLLLGLVADVAGTYRAVWAVVIVLLLGALCVARHVRTLESATASS